MTKAVLGIIGGSGIYDLPGLDNVREEAIASPWGEPSATLRRGEMAGLPIVFLPRHGPGHALSPQQRSPSIGVVAPGKSRTPARNSGP